MRVLIAGGGIGGLTTAIALRHQGIDAVVLEQGEVLTEFGAGIQIAANAAEAAGAAAVVRGRLRVSVDPWFARIVLASKLQQFLSRYPLLSVDFSTSNYREAMMIGVDVADRFGPPDASSLIVRKLLA